MTVRRLYNLRLYDCRLPISLLLPMSLKCRLNYFSTINSIASQTSLIEKKYKVEIVSYCNTHTRQFERQTTSLFLSFLPTRQRILCRDSRESISRDRSIDQVPTARDEWALALSQALGEKRKMRWREVGVFLPHLHTIKKSAGRKE